MAPDIFAYSARCSDELTDDEFIKAEECIQILFDAIDGFESALKENKLTMTDSGEILGSVFQNWFNSYQENTMDECFQCKSMKRLSDLSLVKISIGDRGKRLVCAECKARHKYY